MSGNELAAAAVATVAVVYYSDEIAAAGKAIGRGVGSAAESLWHAAFGGGSSKDDALEVDQAPTLTDKEGKIAQETGHLKKEVKKAIEKVKKNGMSGHAGNTNPDVLVDTKTGEVYPKTQGGGVGDSIGNIYDYLP